MTLYVYLTPWYFWWQYTEFKSSATDLIQVYDYKPVYAKGDRWSTRSLSQTHTVWVVQGIKHFTKATNLQDRQPNTQVMHSGSESELILHYKSVNYHSIIHRVWLHWSECCHTWNAIIIPEPGFIKASAACTL